MVCSVLPARWETRRGRSVVVNVLNLKFKWNTYSCENAKTKSYKFIYSNFFSFMGIFAQTDNTCMKKNNSIKTNLSNRVIDNYVHQYKLIKRNDLRYGPSDLADYHLLPDGRVLIVLDFGNRKTGVLYESEQQLKEVMSEPDIRKDGEHVLSDLILDSKEFLKLKESYIYSLAKRLSISNEKLDKSLESLKIIDSAFNRKKIKMINFFNKDYLYLIAYLGEVYRKEKGGEWYFEKKSKNKSYEPYIMTYTGVLLNPFLSLFKECYENYGNFSIYSIASAALSEYKLKATS